MAKKNATPRDTRAGFDIYRSAGGALALDDLNQKLMEAGYGPVAARTFTHYRHLVDAGYNRYISINRFDVARASTAYENSSSLGRYRYHSVDVGVTVIFAKSSKLFEASGRATEAGDVGAILEFADAFVAEGIAALKLRSGDMVTIRYLEAGRTLTGRVVDHDLSANPATVEIEYARLASLVEIRQGVALPTSRQSFELIGQENERQTTELLGRRLYHFFELIEGARAIVNIASTSGTGQQYAEPPVVDRLSVASPAQVFLELATEVADLVPWGILAGVLRAAWGLPEKRKTWYEGTAQKKQGELLDRESRLKELAIELDELQLTEKNESRTLRSSVLGRISELYPGLDEAVVAELGKLVDDHIVSHVKALGRSGVETIEFETSSEASMGMGVEHAQLMEENE